MEKNGRRKKEERGRREDGSAKLTPSSHSQLAACRRADKPDLPAIYRWNPGLAEPIVALVA